MTIIEGAALFLFAVGLPIWLMAEELVSRFSSSAEERPLGAATKVRTTRRPVTAQAS